MTLTVILDFCRVVRIQFTPGPLQTTSLSLLEQDTKTLKAAFIYLFIDDDVTPFTQVPLSSTSESACESVLVAFCLFYLTCRHT